MSFLVLLLLKLNLDHVRRHDVHIMSSPAEGEQKQSELLIKNFCL